MISLIFKFFLCFLFGLFLWIFLDTCYQYSKLDHYRRRTYFKYSNKILYVLEQLPRLIAQYIEDKRSDDFKEHGLIIFTGKQGQGKTMAMTYYINRLIAKYPDVLIGTNYGFLNQDFVLSDYTQLFEINNGLKGVIFGFDEIQATFNSRAWKDFPPDLLAAICQNRKAHRVIYGTCQNITLVDVAIRKQCMRFAKCYTFFGFLTLVVFFEPDFDFEGQLAKSHFRGLRFFLQNDVLRYQYDTFDLIKSLR